MPHSDSTAYFLFYRAAPFPSLCSKAGQRPENICRPGNGKCFGHKDRIPSRCPVKYSHRQYRCSTHVLTAERYGIAGRSNVVLSFSIGVPFIGLRCKKGDPFHADRPVTHKYSVTGCFLLFLEFQFFLFVGAS